MNEEMNNNELNFNVEKKNNGVKALLIILIVLVLCLIGLIGYKMLVYDKKNDNKQNNNTVDNKEKSESYEEVANKLYLEFVSLGKLCGGFRFPNLNDEETKVLFAYDKVDSTLVKKADNNAAEQTYDKCGAVYSERVFNNECLLETVKITDFEKVYKNLFGSNSQIDYSKLPYNYSVKDGSINKYHVIFGCEGGIISYSILEKYEKKDNDLILYVNTFEIYGPSEEYGELLDYFDKNNIDKNNASNDVLTDAEKREMFKHYKDDIVNYKLSFSKDNDGNYYFTSVQILK